MSLSRLFDGQEAQLRQRQMSQSRRPRREWEYVVLLEGYRLVDYILEE